MNMITSTQTALDAVYEKVKIIFADRLQQPVWLTRIDYAALKTWSETWEPINKREPPNGGWDWFYKRNYFYKKYSARLRFEVAIWNDNELCGLSLGRVTRDDHNNSIHYAEGSPRAGHPLTGNILDIILLTGTEYARLLGKKNIRLVEPVENLIKVYEKRYKFKCLKKKGLFGSHYCEKEVAK
jgi:hypothetical protein